MNSKTLLNVNLPLKQRSRNAFSLGWFKKDKTKEIDKKEKENEIEKEKVADEIAIYRVYQEDTEEIEMRRNKSRLQPQHRKILLGERPYNESVAWFHDTIKYKKRMLGKYGIGALDVPVGIAWPTPQEVENAKEYERVLFPLSLQERWDKLKAEKQKREEMRLARQKDVEAKMAQMGDFINEVKKKLVKKEAELAAAKARKEKLIEEVRRHFGFVVSPQDEKFKEMLAQKEKEDIKKAKDAKKAAKAEKQKQRLLGLAAASTSQKEQPKENPSTNVEVAKE